MYEPLKITAYPRTGIQSNAYLPIDGILFALVMRREYGTQYLTTPGRIPDVEPVELPLEKRIINGVWFYAASFAQWGTCVDYSGFWVKRFDQAQSHLIDFDGKRGKVIVEQGRYKFYHMPTFERAALDVSWYVVGDKAGIDELLRFATHIGKKTAQGCGRINCWTVEVVDEDWSIYGKDGRLMRAIPDDSGVLYGVRPSYWLAENQVRCRLPDID